MICNGKPDMADGSDEQICQNRACQPGDKICDNNKCVPSHQICDGMLNCVDGKDEANCTECFMKCDDTCLAESQICDGNNDCKDELDELNCQSWRCPKGFWKCADGKCVKETYVCDLFPDCEDKSDENNCENWNCAQGFWKCADDRQCIPSTLVCDSTSHCQDLSDEAWGVCDFWNCSAGLFTCKEPRTKCIALDHVCDGYDYPTGCRADNSDERNCEEWTCTERHWKCRDNKQCIPFVNVCDAELNCFDESDEENCERFTCEQTQWKCLNTRHCIESAQVCDGTSDCPNNSDEKGWWIVTFAWTFFLQTGAFWISPSFFAADCQLETFLCPDKFWKCKNARCIPDHLVCDGHFDCSDESDEDNCADWKCTEGHIKCADQSECVKVKWWTVCIPVIQAHLLTFKCCISGGNCVCKWRIWLSGWVRWALWWSLCFQQLLWEVYHESEETAQIHSPSVIQASKWLLQHVLEHMVPFLNCRNA